MDKSQNLTQSRKDAKTDREWTRMPTAKWTRRKHKRTADKPDIARGYGGKLLTYAE
jgi:hypothetical protein